ncbi:nicotinate-nucleotide adenylyltransferase [Peribacillus deserti]|uniref:Probable nicotinate-nucleotide adenylyltransferase n=1 Tax=Peribacillus deserti TaxID=673318 RepID=A0A2N5M9D5_9BACI|nr:nicotinate-nucleotide adenylyltransferase [Peribacillus deserti]PLT30935.1 nicotinic acid mononucleotide adenylyltransferase [Peribacillus deserti]
MKRTGILGGTFDPPHLGHLIVANEVLEALSLDEVRLMPNHIPPHKKYNEDVTSNDRLQMVRISINSNPKLSLETIELGREGASYTYDTIEALREREPDTQFYFIIGADMIEYLPKWHRVEELMKMVQFVGVQRPSYKEETSYPVIMVEMPQIDLSSSLIRQRVKEGKSIRYLVHEDVQKYIEVNKLYES